MEKRNEKLCKVLNFALLETTKQLTTYQDYTSVTEGNV